MMTLADALKPDQRLGYTFTQSHWKAYQELLDRIMNHCQLAKGYHPLYYKVDHQIVM